MGGWILFLWQNLAPPPFDTGLHPTWVICRRDAGFSVAGNTTYFVTRGNTWTVTTDA